MLRILTKHLTNERAWLRTESLGAIDAKYREGARMAKERIPQLEAAIELITKQSLENKPTPKAKATPSQPESGQEVRQLNLFQIFKQ